MKKKSGQSRPNIHLVRIKQENCEDCAGAIECLCAELNPEITNQIKPLSTQMGPFLEGDYLVRRGDRLKSFYLVKNGIIRSETVSYNGRSKVKWFYFPGDLIGMEAMSSDIWPTDLIVTRASMLCEISVSDMEATAQKYPEIQNRLFKRFSDRILNQEHSLASDFSEASMTRVIEYLLYLYKRLEHTEFVEGPWLYFPMTKTILASYLGMSAETLSRILTRLEKDNLIVNQPQALKLNDFDKIRKSLDTG